MRIKDVMTSDLRSCPPETNLAAAAALMLDGDCGILPVIQDGKIAGVVTDRDLYIALATRNTRPSELTVGDVLQAPAHTCAPDASLLDALGAMKTHRVRRLIVEGFGGTAMGIVSVDDLLRATGAGGPLRSENVIEAMQSIVGSHLPLQHVTAA